MKRHKIIVIITLTILLCGVFAYKAYNLLGEKTNNETDGEFIATVRDGNYELDLTIARLDIILPDYDIIYVKELPDIWYSAGVRAVYNDKSAEIIWADDAKWTSGNEDILIVNGGNMIATGVGSAIVTVEYKGVTAQIPIDVYDGSIVKLEFELADSATEMVLLKPASELMLNVNRILLRAHLSNGTSKVIENHNDSENSDLLYGLKLASSDTDIAAVSEDRRACIIKNTGKFDLTIGCGSLEDTVPVRVLAPEDIHDVKITNPQDVMIATYSAILSAVAIYDDNKTIDLDWKAVWTSSDESVVSVIDGFADAHSVGECEITASYAGKSDSFTVTVVAP